MSDLSDIPSEEIIPRAESLIETFRAFGYSPETAIADIVDNSITAGARRVNIRFEWAGPQSVVVISDDGRGMTDAELREAMRPGSFNPLHPRTAGDLGRFGLGLKTASLSQCRRLTVLSKPEGGEVSFRCWDLDHIAQTKSWSLLRWVADESHALRLSQRAHGTTVIWELPDRLTGGLRADSDAHRARFYEMVDRVRRHLEMTFHRYLSDRFVITINDTEKLKPWDPFLVGREGTQLLTQESPATDIDVSAYVLPHHRLLGNDFQAAGGIKGWNAHQGFYIYRNDRLLVAGDWLGLFGRDEHCKLARVAIRIPAALDHEWQIDIRKATARPPHHLRDALKRIGTATRQRAAEVYRDRGAKIRKLTGVELTPVWEQTNHQKHISYRVNRQHPLVAALLAQLPPGGAAGDQLRSALRMIEESLPVPLIALSAAEQPLQQAIPFEADEAGALDIMRQLYQVQRANGAPPAEARQFVATLDPFQHKPHLLDNLQD